jgi:catechol 2,3-dioxygenase-like lactoylglutathione lyase family enzyme
MNSKTVWKSANYKLRNEFTDENGGGQPESNYKRNEFSLRALRQRADTRQRMSIPTKLDHCVIHVTNWERSNAFYTTILGAELVARAAGYAYRFGDKQLNVHGPGVKPAEVARIPVAPGNSDLCFEWIGPIGTPLRICSAAASRSKMGRCGASAPKARVPVFIFAIRTAR